MALSSVGGHLEPPEGLLGHLDERPLRVARVGHQDHVAGSEQLRVPLGEEVRLIRTLGVERVLFGSDFPWYDPERDIAFLSELPLSEGERCAILGENAARLFGL